VADTRRRANPGEVDDRALATAMEKAGRESVAEASFLEKLRKFASRLGREAAERVVAMYHCMRDPDTPVQAKATIAGAVAYFILPLDLIPDALLGVGYTDDIAAIGLAFTAVVKSIKPEHFEAAQQ
jgi:uncharacterized membrane protein YkvA (DUF1232 family)